MRSILVRLRLPHLGQTSIAVRERQIDALVEALLHRAAHERADRLAVVADRVLDVLDFAAVAQVPETSLKVLLFDRRQLLGHMAVEAVGNIRTVGNALDNAVLAAELLDLKAAQALGRCAVDGIQVAVLVLELLDLLVDVFERFEGKCAVLGERFAVIKLLKLVERGDAEGGRRGFHDRLDFIARLEVAAVEAALAVRERIGRGAHLAQISVGADVQLADQLKIEVQDLVERASLLLCLGINHRQVQRNRADVPAADKYRLVVLVCRLHAAALVPR